MQSQRNWGFWKYDAELLPGDKVERVEKLLAAKSEKGRLVFVGDGINDAPVLARADIGIAMGGLGSDAAIEAADVVIMTDEPSKIVKAMQISKKTLSIVKQNNHICYRDKSACIIAGSSGDCIYVGGSVCRCRGSCDCYLNAMRAMK